MAGKIVEKTKENTKFTFNYHTDFEYRGKYANRWIEDLKVYIESIDPNLPISNDFVEYASECLRDIFYKEDAYSGTSVSGLQFFGKIKRLVITNSNFQLDLSDLSKYRLGSLRWIKLEADQIVDLQLLDLPRVEYMFLKSNYDNYNLDFITRLENLKSVLIQSYRIDIDWTHIISHFQPFDTITLHIETPNAWYMQRDNLYIEMIYSHYNKHNIYTDLQIFTRQPENIPRLYERENYLYPSYYHFDIESDRDLDILRFMYTVRSVTITSDGVLNCENLERKIDGKVKFENFFELRKLTLIADEHTNISSIRANNLEELRIEGPFSGIDVEILQSYSNLKQFYLIQPNLSKGVLERLHNYCNKNKIEFIIQN